MIEQDILAKRMRAAEVAAEAARLLAGDKLPADSTAVPLDATVWLAVGIGDLWLDNAGRIARGLLPPLDGDALEQLVRAVTCLRLAVSELQRESGVLRSSVAAGN